jgi:hypothetical protein
MSQEGIIMRGETPHQEGGATAPGARPAAFLLTSRADRAIDKRYGLVMIGRVHTAACACGGV